MTFFGDKLPANWREEMVEYLKERKRKGLVPKYVEEEEDPRKKKKESRKDD